jgi:hypothetical protein
MLKDEMIQACSTCEDNYTAIHNSVYEILGHHGGDYEETVF